MVIINNTVMDKTIYLPSCIFYEYNTNLAEMAPEI